MTDNARTTPLHEQKPDGPKPILRFESPEADSSGVILIVNGEAIPATADYALRFVNHPDRPATPVLYFRGQRVFQAWNLRLSHDEPADPWGRSG